jgi:hypothetical protein
MTNQNFNDWLDTFLDEKDIDLEQTVEAEGPSGLNIIPLENLVEAFKQASGEEKKDLKSMFIKIDYRNGNVIDFMAHLAKAVAV